MSEGSVWGTIYRALTRRNAARGEAAARQDEPLSWSTELWIITLEPGGDGGAKQIELSGEEVIRFRHNDEFFFSRQSLNEGTELLHIAVFVL